MIRGIEWALFGVTLMLAGHGVGVRAVKVAAWALLWGVLGFGFVAIVLAATGCAGVDTGDTQEDVHHECPAPAPVLCAEMLPQLDVFAVCGEKVPGSQPSPWTGRMCAGDGCAVEGYPPGGAFVQWYLCDGIPVELWCIGGPEP